MKLYTRTGDDGTTGLFTGQRVAKDCPRMDAAGSVDELNSLVGWSAAACRHGDLSSLLTGVQHRLFDLGADLATPLGDTQPPAAPSVTRITAAHVQEAEKQIDAVCAKLPELKQFILPGGSELASRLHVARCACRLAERRCVALSHHEQLNPHLLVYLNRLSDLLFAAARLANQLENTPDVVWRGRVK